MDQKKKGGNVRRNATIGRCVTLSALRSPLHVSHFTFHTFFLSLLLLFFLTLSLAPPSYALMPFSLQFGDKGSAPGQFGAEIYLDVDEAGRIFVSDTDNRRIQIFDSGGRLLHRIAASEKPVLEGEAFRFEEPGEIAVAANGHFFVADWKALSVASGTDQHLYFYTPIVHHFDAERRYLGFVAIDSLKWDRQVGERLVPVVDPEARSAYALRGDYKRPLHLTTGAEGDLYVLDERRNKIFRYDRNGVRQQAFGEFGQMDRATSLTVDDGGNVYVADRGNHRVVRFDKQGKITAIIGRRGRRDGEFISPYLVRWVTTHHSPRTGHLLVKDESAFSKVFQSALERRSDDPQPPIRMEDDPEDREEPGYRRYRRWLERVQAFDSGGNFRRKTVLRFTEREHEENGKLIAFGRNGTLYFFNEEHHRIEVFAPEPAFGWNRVQKTYRFQIKQELEKSRVDAAKDLDFVPDYVDELDFRSLSQSLLFQYDVTERLGLSWEGKTLFLGGYRSYLFPGDKLPIDLPEEQGLYVHDYFIVEDVVRGDVEIGLEVALNSDPYDPRRIKGFLELGGITYDFRYETITPENKAHAVQDLWGWNVGLGMDWDIRRDLNGFFHVMYDSPESFMNHQYRYWDEAGDLIVTSSRWGRKWTVYTGMYAAF